MNRLRTWFLRMDDQTVGWWALGILAWWCVLAVMGLMWAESTVAAVIFLVVFWAPLVWLAAALLMWRWSHTLPVLHEGGGPLMRLKTALSTPNGELDDVDLGTWLLVLVGAGLAAVSVPAAAVGDRVVIGMLGAMIMLILVGAGLAAWERRQQRHRTAWWLGLKLLGVLAFVVWFVKLLVWRHV